LPDELPRRNDSLFELALGEVSGAILGMLSEVQFGPAKCFAKKTIWPT
jgi:hypothetical protein